MVIEAKSMAAINGEDTGDFVTSVQSEISAGQKNKN
jgi:hypothetical protein